MPSYSSSYAVLSFVLAPTFGFEELVAETPNIAEDAVLDLVEKLSLEDLAHLAVGYLTRALTDSFEGREDTG